MMLTQAGDSHRCSVHGYYICKIMVVVACFLIQAGGNWLQDPVSKIWSGRLPQWLSYTISDR